MEWSDIEEWQRFALQGLNSEGPLTKALEWNAGIYFFYAGLSSNLKEGISKAKEVINSGFALNQLEKLISWNQKNIYS